MDKIILDVLIKIDIEQMDFSDEKHIKNAFVKLLNIIEQLATENQILKKENQEFKALH